MQSMSTRLSFKYNVYLFPGGADTAGYVLRRVFKQLQHIICGSHCVSKE